MPWVSMSDDVSDNGKVFEAGLLAELLWRRSIEWSNRNLTDGFIPIAKVRTLADWTGIFEEHHDGRLMATPEPVSALALAERLVRVGLWERVERGFSIHDYLKHQPSKREVMRARRERSRQASKAGRASGAKRQQKRNGTGNGTSNGTRTGVSTEMQRDV